LEPRQKFFNRSELTIKTAGPEYWNFYLRGSEPS
jgi:hypothetical protein